MKSAFVIALIGTPSSGKTSVAFNLTSAFQVEKEDAFYTTEDAFQESLLRQHSIVVVDCSPHFTQKTKKILDQAAAILVPTECETPSLNETRKLLDSIYAFLPKDLVYVILNRYRAHEVNPSLVQKQLNCNILGALVDDPVISEAGHTKIAFVTTHPKSMATHYMMQLAKIIHTKKILEKGESLQKLREEVAEDTAVPLQATGTESAPERASRPQQQPKLYNRFAQEETPRDSRTLLKMNVLKQLTSELNLKKLDTETGSDPKKMALLREKTKQAALTIMERDKIHIGDRSATELFIKEILDEALGLGPLEVLLADPTITEIMVNRKDQIYVEKNGKIVLSPMTFTSNSQLLGIIERIVAPLGRRIDEKTPYCDARLLDGSRVHAIIPPLAIQGPMITIRKFSRTPYTVTDLTKFGSITDEMADFLRAAIEARQNCVVSGGTGTGKTTLLNVLSSFIPSSERIITIEDSAELQLSQPHWGRLESRPPNIEGTGAITIRDLVRNTLRMRPDRIVVGECRDGAALDMLQAMNTGHDGSLTTIHSNSPRDCLSRLETLVMMAGMDLPSRAIREQIAAAIHLIVQISRFSDGSRKVVQISEVTGMEKDVITMQDIAVFKQKGLDSKGKVIGEYVFTGNIPTFIHELEKKGLRIPKGFFMKRRTDKTEGED